VPAPQAAPTLVWTEPCRVDMLNRFETSKIRRTYLFSVSRRTILYSREIDYNRGFVY